MKEIRIGEKWKLKEGDGSPWPTKEFPPVTILDVKEGWVRYEIGDAFPDNRMGIKEFTRIYEQVSDV